LHALEKTIQALIRHENLIRPGETLVVGVSGGSDSMALLQILASLAETGGFAVKALYVDHGLRPRETGAEAELVQAAAARLGVVCVVARAEVQRLAREQKLSLEHAGRQLRYELLRQEAARHQAGKIAVAHTADDQAEEVLLRLIRGTGRKGLAGMAYISDAKVIRPLLGTTKETLLRYLADRAIPFLEDSSNRDRRFLRNRVRLDLLPFLEQNFHVGVRTTLRQTAAVLAEEEDYLDSVARASYQQMVRQEGAGLVIAVPALLAQPMAIQRRLLEQALLAVAAKPSFRQIEQVRRLALEAAEGAGLHLAAGLRVWRQGEGLHFAYPQGCGAHRGDLTGAQGTDYEVTITGPGVYSLPGCGREVIIDLLDRRPTPEELRSGGGDFVDLAKVAFPLTLRPSRPGDRFHPLGAPGTKKLGDFFTDQKVARDQRYRPLLVVAGRIALVPGLRVAQWARVTTATVRTLRVRS
jgi:tRNA(Ile)-lysidine synthase